MWALMLEGFSPTLLLIAALASMVLVLALWALSWVSSRRRRAPAALWRAAAPQQQAPAVTSSAAPESALPLLYEDLRDDDDFEITVMGELKAEFLEMMDGTESSAAIITAEEPEPYPDIDIEVDEDAKPLILVTGRARTDRGLKRHANEDAYLIMEEVPLFLVADGMGGYAGGEVASALAVEIIERAFRRRVFAGAMDLSKPPESDELVRSVQMAHKAVHQRALREPKLQDMGTTVVALRFATKNRVVHIAHVGDSRCYRIRDGALTQLTRDHTMSTLFGVEGKAGRRLAQAVGVRDEVIIDLNLDYPFAGDTYLVCSDGLTKMVDDETILRFALEGDDLESKAARMIEEANRRGGRDNITVIVIHIDDPPS